MMNKPKTREEWQKIVNDFSPEQQTKKDYCGEKNIEYGSFRNWYYKLRLKPWANLQKEDKIESKLNVLPEIRKKEALNKEFVAFKLIQNTTKINLPNGINIEVAAEDVIGLIKKLMHVA